MATNWATQVRKYAADADDAVIAGIVRYCGIALEGRDGALVAFSDKEELTRVRDSFLKRKLGLKVPDSELDAAIAKVGALMKGNRARQRVTVYYLLAQHFDQLGAFSAKTKPAAAKPATKKAASAKAAPLKASSAKAGPKTKAAVKLRPVTADTTASATEAPTPAPAEPAAETAPIPAPPQQLAVNRSDPSHGEASSSLGNLWWILLALVLLAFAWSLLMH